MPRTPGNPLIRELLDQPATFVEEGKAYQLLQEYIHGLQIETLRPLLKDSDIDVRRQAIWILSELGDKGCSLLDDVVPLARSDDRRSKYFALDVIATCAVGHKAGRYSSVVESLESEDDVIRARATQLIARASTHQIESVVRSGTIEDALHLHHLQSLVDNESIAFMDAERMLSASQPVVRLYGAIVAWRLRHRYPGLIATAIKSDDADVRQFAMDCMGAELSGSGSLQ